MNENHEIELFLDEEEITCEEIHGMYMIPPDGGGC